MRAQLVNDNGEVVDDTYLHPDDLPVSLVKVGSNMGKLGKDITKGEIE